MKYLKLADSGPDHLRETFIFGQLLFAFDLPPTCSSRTYRSNAIRENPLSSLPRPTGSVRVFWNRCTVKCSDLKVNIRTSGSTVNRKKRTRFVATIFKVLSFWSVG